MELLSPLRTADPSFLEALWRGCVCPPAFPERTEFFGSQLAAPAGQVLRMCPQRHYTPILPLFICGLLLIYWGRSEGQTSSPGPQSALAPPVQRRFGCWWDATVGWHPKQIRGLQRPRRQRSPKAKGTRRPSRTRWNSVYPHLLCRPCNPSLPALRRTCGVLRRRLWWKLRPSRTFRDAQTQQTG